ncbi:MAG: polyphenol oxidase family protein [Treponema sp.]|nr:polyphenol oxidase family protein [Treponema sp.]
MTLRKAGSMRFRWNETNENRTTVLQKICGEKQPVPLELIHSKIVYAISSAADTQNKTGDGMITVNRMLVPVVTVADCMPLFLYEPKTGVFGACHSGWKGTGIIAEAISLAQKNYGARVEDILVAIGPHIHDCCYTVDEERARYFSEQFTPDSVQRIADKDGVHYQLSLEKANLSVLARAGIRDENIVTAKDCTSCAQDAGGEYPFGSFRRQAAFAPGNLTTEARSKLMTVQAAFCGWIE